MLKIFRRSAEKLLPLDAQISAVLQDMQQYGVDSPEYAKLLSYLERLYKLKDNQRPQRVSRDTVWTVAGSFVSIIAIVAYEQKHVWTTKADRHIIQPKIPTQKDPK